MEKKLGYTLERDINSAVFPGLQGGPHNNVIAAVAVTMNEVSHVTSCDTVM